MTQPPACQVSRKIADHPPDTSSAYANPSGIVHKHLAPSVRIFTKSQRDSMAELTEQQDQEREVILGRTPKIAGGISRITGRTLRDETPEYVSRDLNPQEVAEMLEDMRAQITQLEQQSAYDRVEASGRERRLEKDNATLMRALARGVEHREALDWAGELDRATTSQQTGTPGKAKYQ
ncbi:hypothetical protein ACLB2K_056345 [Fragaria x ananassa]